LKEYVEKMSLTFTLTTVDDLTMSKPEYGADPKWYQLYEEVVDKVLEMKQQHMELVIAIKPIVPDFNFVQD
jgi:hypothetical protein